jgi:hypothetical protein
VARNAAGGNADGRARGRGGARKAMEVEDEAPRDGGHGVSEGKRWPRVGQSSTRPAWTGGPRRACCRSWERGMDCS